MFDRFDKIESKLRVLEKVLSEVRAAQEEQARKLEEIEKFFKKLPISLKPNRNNGEYNETCGWERD